MASMRLSTIELPIQNIRKTESGWVFTEIQDCLAVEEPLEIRLEYTDHRMDPPQSVRKSISITMRTPGSDFELALGFLFTEGIIRNKEDVNAIQLCGPAMSAVKAQNIVVVELKPHVRIDIGRLERHFYTSSSCGVCGKTSIEALKIQTPFPSLKSDEKQKLGPFFRAEQIAQFPDFLRASQATFEKTGGLHASGLFSTDGRLLLIREDVGRHNALDKVIGYGLNQGMLPLSKHLLLVSGRASFELVQKAAIAGIPILAAVGAPSSLAIELAAEAGLTLIGFLREGRFNIYSGSWRILPNPAL